MSSAVLPPLSRRQERWTTAGLFAVNALSARTEPLFNGLPIVPPGEAALGRGMAMSSCSCEAIGLVSLAGVVAAVALVAPGVLRTTTDSSECALVVALLGAGVALLFAYQFTRALWLMCPYVYQGLLSAGLARRASGADAPALM